MSDEPRFEFDVFISYSSHDKDWVRGELLPHIEHGTGLKACIDFRDFAMGALASEEMKRGVQKSRKTLVVVTPDYITSACCEFEASEARRLDPDAYDRRTIPLLRKFCKPPDYIERLTRVDFTDTARLDTAWHQLLTALGRPPEPKPVATPECDHWLLAHPYPMPPNFTGRHAERTVLTEWLQKDADHPLLILRALGGFGKSALAWHWLTGDVAPAMWQRVVWWCFYESVSGFDRFLSETLDYCRDEKFDPALLSAKDGVTALLRVLRQPGTLLILDGFEWLLRAFSGLDAAYHGDEPGQSDQSDRDSISPLAHRFLYHVATQPNIGSKVLLTTRLRPRVLETWGGEILQGCREERLEHMQASDAVEFFHAQGIRGTRAEIQQACEPYGYHPLSLRLLASSVVSDPRQPGDIAAVKRLDASGDLAQQQNHILKTAYEGLTPRRQALLSRMACFRGSVAYEALSAIQRTEDLAYKKRQQRISWWRRFMYVRKAEKSQLTTTENGAAANCVLDSDLRDLVARGLLHLDAREGHADLHPIVRRYAYDRLSLPERTATHAILRHYFAAMHQPSKVIRLEELAPVVELYYHTIRAGQFEEAFALFLDRLALALPRLGAYRLVIDLLQPLFIDGEDRPPRLRSLHDQAFALHELSLGYAYCGEPRRSLSQIRCALDMLVQQTRDVATAATASQGYQQTMHALRVADANQPNIAAGLINAGTRQRDVGELRSAESNMRRGISMWGSAADGFAELGLLLAYCGSYAEADEKLMTALRFCEEDGHKCAIWAFRSCFERIRLRAACNSSSADVLSPLFAAREALALANEAVPFETALAHWTMGAALRIAGETADSEHHLDQALETLRRKNMVEFEAEVLLDMSRLRAASGSRHEAQLLAMEALSITERSGYVLQGADARLELAKLAFAEGKRAAGIDHAREALRLATCSGPPDHTYKVAYEEAGALLAEHKMDPEDHALLVRQ